MERLQFGKDHRYQAIEAAVHIARYSMARPVTAGKRVLDIACGEGYGAYAMATRWGAAHVTAIDIASEAIQSARTNFSADNIEFLVGSAESLADRFPSGSFDLIVSFETIEHLDNPELFLSILKKVATADATVIISCPNDYQHYPRTHPGNPFHKRQYTSHDFFGMADDVIGMASKRFIGTPILGFGNYAVDMPSSRYATNPTSIVDGTLEATLPAIRILPDDQLDLDSASYYVGVWDPSNSYPEDENVAVYPCAMQSAAQAQLSDEIRDLRSKVWGLEKAHQSLQVASPSTSPTQSLPEPTLGGDHESTYDFQDRISIPPEDSSESLPMATRLRQKALKIHILAAENTLARQGIERLKIEIQDSHDRLNVLQEKIERLSKENSILQKNSINTEKELKEKYSHISVIKAEIEIIRSELKIANSQLIQVPWRVVGVYRRLRKYLPANALRFMAGLLDRARH